MWLHRTSARLAAAPSRGTRHNRTPSSRTARLHHRLSCARGADVGGAHVRAHAHIHGGMKADEAKRLRQLEAENARLKKLLAEAELDKAMLKELAEGNF